MEIKDRVKRQDITILYKNLGSEIRGSVFRKGDRWFIVVNKNDQPERQNFTIAHEYCEIQLYDRQDLTLDEKHNLANKMASELLLPDNDFRPAAQTENLHELKRLFPGASYEVIARRLPHVRPVVVSILDNMQVTSRFGTPNLNFPRHISPIELDIAHRSFKLVDTVTVSEPPLNITGYCLEENNGIVRVYIITEIDESAHDFG